MQHLVEIFRRHYAAIPPQPTGVLPQLAPLPGVRAVLFDLYGTLFISGSGEVGTVARASSQAAVEGAMEAMGLQPLRPPVGAVEQMQDRVRAVHAETTHRHGIECPEVQIAEIWSDVLAELARQGVLDADDVARLDFAQFAVEYEARANPCWPMPGWEPCLAELRRQGLLLGIVSNAQFYTPLLFPALADRSAEQCGFEPDLQFYSYRHGHAKPGAAIFALAVRALAQRGIAAGEALYVGNDMLNDVAPAARLGLRTALFAGDARSLRLRRDDARAAGVNPTIVVTDLAEIPRCTMIAERE